jgi:hypothetical protein
MLVPEPEPVASTEALPAEPSVDITPTNNPIDLIAALIAESKHWAGGGAVFNRFDIDPPFNIGNVERLIKWLRDLAEVMRKRRRAMRATVKAAKKEAKPVESEAAKEAMAGA